MKSCPLYEIKDTGLVSQVNSRWIFKMDVSGGGGGFFLTPEKNVHVSSTVRLYFTETEKKSWYSISCP